ncbi:MAG: S8 family peptidase [Armatimonadota bacterium]|nr:S8 family peptidase [Armatimonadota bacterium]
MLTASRRLFLVACAVLVLLAVAPLAAAPEDNGRAGKIVIFDPAILDRNAREIIVRGAGGTDLKALPLVNGLAAALPVAALSVLSTRPGVIRVDDDLALYATGRPGQPAQSIPWGIERVEAPAAWPICAGQGARVAVLDTGIQLDHPDLAGNIAGGYNAVNPARSPNDNNGHGTHVAGTIAAIHNEIGVVGIAYDARLYAVKVLNNSGAGRLSDLVDGLDWCINNGIQVVNMSLGSATDNATFHEAIIRAYQAGLVQVAAAGNNGGLFGGTGLLDYPAAYPEVIAVSAVDAAGNFATFSSSGGEVGLAAPGVDVLSTYRHSGYATKSGTSMAAPHVTGAAALFLSMHPEKTPDEVKSALQSAAVDIGLPPEQQGAGLVNVAGLLAPDTTNRLVCEVRVAGVINPNCFYYVAIDNDGDPNDGPEAVIGPPWGNGWGRASITHYVQYDTSIPQGGYGLFRIPDPDLLGKIYLGPPLNSIIPGPGGNTLRFALDLDDLALPPQTDGDQIRTLDINLIATDVVPVDPSFVGPRQWDALGDHSSSAFLRLDITPGRVISNTTEGLEPEGDVSNPDLDIVDWSIEVQRTEETPAVVARAGLAPDIPAPEGGIKIQWDPVALAGGRNVVEYHIWRDIETAPVGAVAPSGITFFIDDVGPGTRAVSYTLVDPLTHAKSTATAIVDRPWPGLAHQYYVSAVYQVEQPAGSGVFNYYETDRLASGLATIVSRMTIDDLLEPVPGRPDIDPMLGIFFQFHSRRGADSYIVQVCSSPSFVAPQYTSPIIPFSPATEDVPIPFNTGNISSQLGSIPPGTPVWWRVGARNSLDQPGPLPNMGNPDYCFLFSEPSVFFIESGPPPPP